MYITAQGPRLQNDLYCVKWDVKLYYTVPYHTIPYLTLMLVTVRLLFPFLIIKEQL